VHQAGGARPVPAAVRVSRASRWPHGPPGRCGRWPAGSAIRNLPRKIWPSRNIRATGVAQSFRGSQMFHANGNSGTGAQHGAAPGPHARARGPSRPARTRLPARTRPRTARARGPHPPARARGPDRVADRTPDLRDTIYGTRSGWPHRHRPRPFSLSNSAYSATGMPNGPWCGGPLTSRAAAAAWPSRNWPGRPGCWPALPPRPPARPTRRRWTGHPPAGRSRCTPAWSGPPPAP
jgi:hypothetical protein